MQTYGQALRSIASAPEFRDSSIILAARGYVTALRPFRESDGRALLDAVLADFTAEIDRMRRYLRAPE
jgi:hypothetical protein